MTPALLLSATLLAGPAAALGAANKGTSAAAFLKLPAGARAAALGDAFGALEGGALSAAYNPAALGRLAAVELAGTHESRFQDLTHDFGALAVPLAALTDSRRARTAWGGAALSVRTLGASDIPRRGVVETEEPTGTFGASDACYALSYGRGAGALSVGGTLKLVEQKLDSARGRAAAADAGFLWSRDRLTLGGGLRHWGQSLSLGSTPDPLPMTLFGAAAWRAASGLTAAAEVRLPRDDGPRLSVGLEFAREFSGFSAAARAGWNAASAEADGLGGVTAGAGARWGRLSADFAWVPYGDLGASYLTTLSFRF